MRPHILLSISETDAAFEKMRADLQPFADVDVCDLENYTLEDADIFIGKMMSAEKLKTADKLKAVFAYKTGVDDFPVAELGRRGILLVNSHINSLYIAQYAFGLAVTLVGRIAEFDRRMRLGDWANDNPYWKSLFDMKAGLMGYGHIGREIHKLLTENNIECYTIDRGKNYGGILTVPSAEELCAAADIIFISLPKTPQTDNMFGEKLFSLLKGKYIVNVGRSNCIDEGALYRALSGGVLAGAAIDTWREKARGENERLLPFDYPFNELDNILLSSHKAMQLRDGHARYVDDITKQIIKFISGAAPDNAVDCKRGY